MRPLERKRDVSSGCLEFWVTDLQWGSSLLGVTEKERRAVSVGDILPLPHKGWFQQMPMLALGPNTASLH